MKNLKDKLLGLLFGLCLAIPVVAFAQQAKLDLRGTPMIVALSGNNFTLATESTDDIRVVHNGDLEWQFDGGTGDLTATDSGNTLALQEATGADACSGTETLNGATPVTVSTTCATTGSRIFLTRTTAETGAFSYYADNIVDATSFDVTSEAGDTGVINWVIFHESP